MKQGQNITGTVGTASLSGGISDVSTFPNGSGGTSVTYGRTGQDQSVRPTGMISAAVAWLMEEKWYGITGLSILLSGAFLAFIFFVSCVWWRQVHHDNFWMNSKHYSMVGLAEVQQGIYAPVYKEIK